LLSLLWDGGGGHLTETSETGILSGGKIDDAYSFCWQRLEDAAQEDY